MRQGQSKIDQDSVSSDTYFQKQYAETYIESALRYMADPDRKKRLKDANCKVCFYLRNMRVGGAAMTERPCGICGKDVMYSSTATDKLCEQCAIKKKLCRQCGGDLHMRERRHYE